MRAFWRFAVLKIEFRHSVVKSEPYSARAILAVGEATVCAVANFNRLSACLLSYATGFFLLGSPFGLWRVVITFNPLTQIVPKLLSGLFLSVALADCAV